MLFGISSTVKYLQTKRTIWMLFGILSTVKYLQTKWTVWMLKATLLALFALSSLNLTNLPIHFILQIS